MKVPATHSLVCGDVCLVLYVISFTQQTQFTQIIRQQEIITHNEM